MSHKQPPSRLKYAANSAVWALGKRQRNGFHVRRVVWGLLMAQSEKREDEEIRAGVLLVERNHKPRRDVTGFKDAPMR